MDHILHYRHIIYRHIIWTLKMMKITKTVKNMNFDRICYQLITFSHVTSS